MFRLLAQPVVLVLVAALCQQEALLAQERTRDSVSIPAALREFVQVHCTDCHDSDRTKGGLDLTIAPVGKVAQLWRWSHMRDRVHAFEMPPVDLI